MELTKVINTFGTLMEKRSFIWNIANFMEIKESDQQINAQQTHFKIGSTIGLPLKLKCFLQVKKGESVRSAGVFLELIQVKKNADVKIKWTVIQVAYITPFRFGKPVSEVADDFVGHGRGNWGLLPLDLNKQTYSSKLTQDGALPIKILVTLYNIKAAHTEPASFSGLTTIQAEYQIKFCRRFAKDLKQLRKNKYLRSMVTLVSKDGVNFQVDKSLLAVRCPELGKLVDQGPLDIRSEALGVVLHFLKTGTLNDNWSKADVLPEIVLAAHYYKLEDLKDFLNVVLGQVCAKKNAANLLILAKRLGMKRATMELLDFIRKNFEKEKLERIMEAEKTFEGWGKQQAEKTGILNRIKRITGF